MRGRAAGAVLLVVLTAGCGLGDKQHRADAIIESVDKAVAAGTARGTLAVRVEALTVPDLGQRNGNPQTTDKAAPKLPSPRPVSPPVTFGLGLDFAHRRALMSRDAKHAEVFDDLDMYATRLGISDRDVRPWLRLRIRDLEEGEGELRVPEDSPVGLANAINPMVLIDLAAGALAGSIEPGVADMVGDVPVTRYGAAFDVEKALEKTRKDSYPEKVREAIETSFALLTIKGGVNQGTAWVDKDGALRRFRLQLRVSRQRDFVFGVEFDLVLNELGGPVVVAVPDDATILEADSVVAFLRSVVPELAGENAA